MRSLNDCPYLLSLTGCKDNVLFPVRANPLHPQDRERIALVVGAVAPECAEAHPFVEFHGGGVLASFPMSLISMWRLVSGDFISCLFAAAKLGIMPDIDGTGLRCSRFAIWCSGNDRTALYCRQADFICSCSTEIRFGGSAPLHRCPSLRSGHRPLTAADG